MSRDRLSRLRGSVRRAPESGGADESLVLDLETAYEELRVADEEVRVQHEEITRLVRMHEAQRAEHDRLMTVLPVPVVVTDGYGVVRLVNAAAAVLAGTRPERLVGKPVFSLFAPDSRRPLRELLGRLRSGVEGGGREVGTFVTRRDEVIPVEVAVTSAAPDRRHVTWMVLDRGAAGQDDLGLAEVPENLTRLASVPAADQALPEVLRAVVAICADLFGPACSLTVTVGSPSDPSVVMSSGPVAQVLDGAQLRHGGPALEAHATEGLVWSSDLRQDDRWPDVAREAGRHGVAGVVAAPMLTAGRIRGVLTVYRDAPGTDDHYRDVAQTVALTVAGLLQERDLVDDVRRARADMDRALTSRAVIDQAKGVVMAQKGCTPDEAFEHLVSLASTQHVKLRTVAAAIVEQAQGR